MTVRCTLHDEGAWIAVVPHPHHARTDPDGRFELLDVPAVQVEVRAWSDGRWSSPVVVGVAAGTEQPIALAL